MKFGVLILCLLILELGHAQQGPPEIPPTTTPESTTKPPLPNLPKMRRSWNLFSMSQGYMLGRVVSSGNEGWIWKRFEGTVLLSFNSTLGGVLDSKCVDRQTIEIKKANPAISDKDLVSKSHTACTAEINPFYFSSYFTSWPGRAPSFNSSDAYIIRFQGYVIHPFLKSAYVVKEVIPVKDYALPVYSLDESKNFTIYPYIQYADSYFDGRVVIASQEGIVRKHYQAIMQVGTSGGEFVHLEIPTARLYDFIVDAMATGNMLRVYYYELYGLEAFPSNLLKGYTTNLRAYRVDVLR